MAGTKEIKNRIKSVKNTKKITKAMELVAASKMKRSVSSALASRLYAEYSWNILSALANGSGDIKHPLFSLNKEEGKNKERILLFMITSNRGLCGAYNAQIIKKVIFDFKRHEDDFEIDVVTIGKKGDAIMRKSGKNIIASFFGLPDNLALKDVVPIGDMALNEYKSGKYNRVLIAYTDFISALSQKPKVKQVIPVRKENLKSFIESLGDGAVSVSDIGEELKQIKDIRPLEYLFEGDKETFLNGLAEKIIKMQIYQMFLESSASEQSARMMAMKNASEAATEMIDDLTLDFNKARQSNITREISEISAGMASIN